MFARSCKHPVTETAAARAHRT